MELKSGDRVQVKKAHPCGGSTFLLLRVGMDVRMRCETCGREVTLLRKKAEKSIRAVLPPEEADHV